MTLSEARLEVLRSRMNPHFLFNTLNSISTLALKGDNDATVEMLARLSEHAVRHTSPVVPDPYSGGRAGFEQVLDLVQDACEGLVATLLLQRGREVNGTS